MNLFLDRYGKDKESTGGAMRIAGSAWFAHTCEDEKRVVKVAGETRIPAGCYEIKIRDAGKMNVSYHKRFNFHRGMLHLQDVQGFEWIYIHPLNDESQTDGCIGVGFTALSRGGFEIARSTEAYEDLYHAVIRAMDAGDKVFITIRDEREMSLEG